MNSTIYNSRTPASPGSKAAQGASRERTPTIPSAIIKDISKPVQGVDGLEGSRRKRI